VTSGSSLRRYGRAIQHFAAARGPEVLALQASPILGALFGSAGWEGIEPYRIALLLAGSVALTAHVWFFNDWVGHTSDRNDSRRVTAAFGYGEITSRELAGLAVGFLITATLILAMVGLPALLLGAAIAALSMLYSGSPSWGKGRPIVASLIHVIGGMFHFLLGYTVGQAFDGSGFAIGLFFGLVFAGGHLNQEVRDYDADLRNAIRTNAVAFGVRRTFVLSLVVFTAAYALLLALVTLGILPRLLVWTALLWPCHLACSLAALRRGVGFQAARWMQRQYRILFALLGFAMVLTTPPAVELARRAERAHDPTAGGALYRQEADATDRKAPEIHRHQERH
jgi:4-hydroxybenzoate polyprenyltransferase